MPSECGHACPSPLKVCSQNRDLGRRANQIAIYGGSGFRIATFYFVPIQYSVFPF